MGFDKAIINDRIQSHIVTLILEDGTKQGDMTKELALQIARETEMDLIQVSPPRDGKHAICKLGDFGKIKYREDKKKKGNVSQKAVLKEMWIGMNCADHDIGVKNKKVEEFLGKKQKVRYCLKLAGREKYQPKERAVQRLFDVLKAFEEIATWDPKPNISIDTVSVTLHPK